MASMLVSSTCFLSSGSEEDVVLQERFQGLRKPAFGSGRRVSVSKRCEVVRDLGLLVRATSVRPGRYVKERGGSILPVSPEDGRINFLEDDVRMGPFSDLPAESGGGMWVKPLFQRKTKIVCTIGPTSDTKEMIWKLADGGMNVARLNMSHGDHASHKKVLLMTVHRRNPLQELPTSYFSFEIVCRIRPNCW